MFPEHRFAATPEQISQLVALTRPPGKTALDLCCGPGRCAIALAALGFSVTGVDRTEFLLNKARQHAQAAGQTIEWVTMDMRDFVRPQAFDLIINMFTSFGYFDDKTEDLRVLRHIRTSLTPGGVFLLDTMGKELLAKQFQPTISAALPDGTALIQRHEVFDNWTRIKNDWIVIRGESARTFTFHHSIYSAQELMDRLHDTGFINVRVFGSLTGEPYGPTARRLIVTGTAPDATTDVRG